MDPRLRTALRLVWTIVVAQAAFILLLGLFLSPAVAVGSVAALLVAVVWVARRRRKMRQATGGAAGPSSTPSASSPRDEAAGLVPK
ncbi:MAG: hypothetical protein QXO51_06835 [Halobacteria archaeon]